MEILSMRIIEGPNIYSLSPVLCIKINIGKYQDIPTCDIAGFNQRLLAIIPSLDQHCCSPGYPGGFVQRLNRGTYLAHVFEHVILEIQCLAGFQVGYGKTRWFGVNGTYNVVVGYRQAQAAKIAAQAALTVILAALHNNQIDIDELIQQVITTGEQNELGPSTLAIYQAAIKRNIPVTRLGSENLLVLGYGCRQQRVWATLSGQTSVVASDLVSDKDLTKKILLEQGIPVPGGQVVNTSVQAIKAWQEIGRPVAIKPLFGNQGKGVTLKVNTAAEVERSFSVAQNYGADIVVEEYIPGKQYRLCVVNGKVIAAAERIPAYIVGDGQHAVKELVEIANQNPLRGDGHAKVLSKLSLDSIALAVLSRQKATINSVPAKNEIVYLRDSANLSTGGTAVDVTDIVHCDFINMAVRAARLVGLDIAGVDIVAQDITEPYRTSSNAAAIIEINAAPGIRMHHYPSAGKPRDVAAGIIDYLFPNPSQGRIPITAITGTNGKTTVARMIGHIWRTAGKKVGMTTTDGIFIDSECIMSGDTTGPASAKIVLTDPGVQVAVLETARGGILRGGLAFDYCDVGIITNITEDHLGQDGIEDLQDMAFIKSLVVETVIPGGVAVLNADDQIVTQIASRVKASILYFSTEPDNIIIKRHLGAGGKALFVKNNVIYSACGCNARPIVKVSDIPVTLGGIAKHNVQNAVIAAAACVCQSIPLAIIRRGLKSFQSNPGRLNIMNMGSFRVCIDYGHNPAGYAALIHTANQMGAKRVIGVIAAPGDRRDDVIKNIGRIAGRGFDKIYIKEDADLRGRLPGEVANLLLKGITEANAAKQDVQIILSEPEAVKAALEQATPGDFVVVFYEKYQSVMNVIDKYCEQAKSRKKPREYTKRHYSVQNSFGAVAGKFLPK